ncbi:AP-1 complex-associated regulatory protein-like isoform X1 [Megalops cyprinoides]|uniref:AP-1 complex-associated regulatory protein-like isoform X1 n=1 Tax=Megalops cyprinoides TaxID=118141 RepID=UPI0018647B25|nr:AP-1 complex-associated regulatory protein-like isoform X1 [Megalops cyprinoides]
MGTCWTQCCKIFRREASRIQRGRGSKYFRSSTPGEHYTIEFENLVDSDEEQSPQSCARAISEEEMGHLKALRYAAISDKQAALDEKLRAELAAQEEQLRQEEEARCTAQRLAARAARECRLKEQLAQRVRVRPVAEGIGGGQKTLTARAAFEPYLQNVKARSEAFRSSRLSSENNGATPNTESSCDFTSKTRSSNDDATSLDLEWDDEEGMTRIVPVRERSRTEEDILQAVLRLARRPAGSGPTSTSEDSTALEWENDFISAHVHDSGGDSEYDGFVNPVLDTPSGDEATGSSSLEMQDR